MLKKIIFYLCFIFVNNLFAKNVDVDCFIIKHNENVVYNEGDSCNIYYSPASTFKIIIAIMGYNENILVDENNPLIHSPKNVYYDFWQGEKTPKLWIKDSVLWYSQYITELLGKEKFIYYINLLEYGNKDVSGSDILTRSWISSTLKISPIQKLYLIEKLSKNDLPVSLLAQSNTKKIIFTEKIGKYSLYSKTGMSTLIDSNQNKTKYHMGYFVGFLESENDKYYFVIHVTENKKNNQFASLVAKDIAMTKINDLIVLSK